MSVWRNQKGRWIAKFRWHGRQYKHQARTRAAAEKWEAEKRVALGAARLQPTRSVSLQELATAYLEYCRPRMRHNTVRQKAHVYRSLIAFMGGDAPACDITTRTISDYLTGIANSKNNITSNRHRRDLAALYAWGIRQGAVDVHPVAGIEPLPEDPAPRCIPPAADIASVRLAAMGDERDFLECIYHLAARRGEIVRMKWEDVNFEHSAVRLWTRKRRGGALQPDWVPMNDTLYGILRSRWKRRDKADPVVFALSSKALRNMMPKLCQQAGVKPFGFHAIRHHVASILNDSGKASMRQIQTILRHRRQATTEQYLHTVDHDIRRVAKILNGQSGTPGTHKKAAADGNDNR